MKRDTKKKFDVIVVGELNVDLILNHIESFPETGKEKLAGEMAFTLGSSSAIFASNLSSLGLKVAFIAKTGNDLFAQFCKNHLEKKGVDVSMIKTDDKLQTGVTVVLNFGEDRANITYQGSMKDLHAGEISVDMLSQGTHLHFSSYFLQPGFKDDLYLLFDKAKKAGLTTSLDLQWDPAEKWDFDYKQILPVVDVFLPNEKELLSLTKQSSVDAAIEAINDYANIIVVKKGKEGSIMRCNNNSLTCKAFLNEQVVDAIGAGDSFNAGFIFRFLQNAGLDDCQQFGNLIGAVSTTKAGGTSAFINYKETMKTAKEKFGYEE